MKTSMTADKTTSNILNANLAGLSTQIYISNRNRGNLIFIKKIHKVANESTYKLVEVQSSIWVISKKIIVCPYHFLGTDMYHLTVALLLKSFIKMIIYKAGISCMFSYNNNDIYWWKVIHCHPYILIFLWHFPQREREWGVGT